MSASDTPSNVEDFNGGPLPTLPSRTPASDLARDTTKGPTATRFRTLNDFVDCSLADLDNASDIKVWVILFRDAKPDGTARTSQADIARRAGMTDRTVRNAIDRLTDCGLLAVESQGGFPKRTSTYRVVPVAPMRQPRQRGKTETAEE
jgi:hypothetical protein